MVTGISLCVRLPIGARVRLARKKVTRFIRGLRTRITRWNSLGARGERYAARYLERTHFYIWARNVRQDTGEIDLIASKGRILVFVEVKTRSTAVLTNFSGIESVDQAKSQRIEQLAARYLRDHRALVKRRRIRSYRIDIIEVEKGMGHRSFRVRQHVMGG